MKFIKSFIAPAAIALFLLVPAYGQETQLTVVDEGVAQVNDVVITLSRINREINNAVDSMVREGKDREEAKAEIDGKRGRLIASIIEEELIMQKGKELGMERDVEARINQQFVQQKDEMGFKSLDELFAAMRAQGIDPDDIRANLRSQITRQWVFQTQVDEQVRWNITDKDIQAYFEKHKEKFTAPATVTLSEIFLSFAGKNVDQVRQRAKDIVARLRAGEDFTKVAVETSDRVNVSDNKGSVGQFEMDRLADVFKTPVESTDVGGVTDPIEITEGIEILRVDAKTEQGTESNFDKEKVLQAMMEEQVPPARKQYLKILKDDAYIKLAEKYRPIVSPFLTDEGPEETTASK
ncbi:MAG: peptidylprolyl isomerase [Aridibacter famidurans]|nr:peptidylprolyl isomerase [Aridibacter famidurans]